MKINSIEQRSENCYQVSVEANNGQCFIFDFPFSPTEKEIESMLTNVISQTEVIE